MIEKYLNKITCIDALQLLKDLPTNSIDTIITDPPYGLKFMGKKWDYELPSVEVFSQMLRVAKPGTILLCFGGSRTYHRLTCNIEDAGWEIRDCMMWLYGSGFPKSRNFWKDIDILQGCESQNVGKKNTAQHSFKANPGSMMTGAYKESNNAKEYLDIYKPTSKEAKEWEGYGSALKPAFEPIVLAMKPVEKNFAKNALKYGVAGLNIDEGRIPFSKADREAYIKTREGFKNVLGNSNTNYPKKTLSVEMYLKNSEKGRFPSNVIMDKEVGNLLDTQSGNTKSTGGGGNKSFAWSQAKGKDTVKNRFFYCPKPSQSERNCGMHDGNSSHPTVKPLKLIEYLCKLTKPPKGGIVLDPFAGSCTTAVACRNTARDYICCDLDEEYCRIGRKRLSYGSLFE